MKKYFVVSTVNPKALYLLILVILFLSGCAGMLPAIPGERQIALTQGDTIKGDYKYGWLILDYNYSLTHNSITLTGKVTYQDRFDSLDVRVLFLDSGGKVLQRKFIYSSGYRTGSGTVSDYAFHDTFDVPVGSKAITFTSSVRERSGYK